MFYILYNIYIYIYTYRKSRYLKIKHMVKNGTAFCVDHPIDLENKDANNAGYLKQKY